MPGLKSIIQVGSSWHQQLKTIAVDNRVAEGRLDSKFPLEAVQQHTTRYLTKKKLTPFSDRCDDHLKALINEHAPRYENATNVAVIACLHRLSSTAGRDILRARLPANDAPGPEFVSRYLRLLVISNLSNPEVVSIEESRCADAFLRLFHSSPGPRSRQLLRELLEVLDRLYRLEFFSHPAVLEIPRSSCVDLDRFFKTSQKGHAWLDAFRESSWLAQFWSNSRSHSRALILDKDFRDAPIWATWKPDLERLKARECLSLEERQDLGDILALEGPDLTWSGGLTLQHGLSLCKQGRRPTFDDYAWLDGCADNKDRRQLLTRLLVFFDVTVASGPDWVALFSELLSRTPIDTEILSMMEVAAAAKDITLATATFDATNMSSIMNQMVGITTLLPFLDADQGLRALLLPRFRTSIGHIMHDAQNMLCNQLEAGKQGENVGTRICRFGKALQKSAWLHDSLSSAHLALIDDLPSDQDLAVIFRLRQSSNESSHALLEDVTRSYLQARLAGRGSFEGKVKDVSEFLVDFWQRCPNGDRRAVGLALCTKVPDLPPDLRKRCLERLPGMRDSFVNGIRPILNKNNDAACVEFVDLIISERVMVSEKNGCWQDLLRHIIENGGQSLLHYSSKSFAAKEWFEWIQRLRGIFGLHSGLCFFDKPLFDWSSYLSSTHLDVIQRLSQGFGRQCDLRWILLRDTRSVRETLGTLENVRSSMAPSVRLALSQLSADGANSTQFCEAISRFSRVSDLGADACSHVSRWFEQLSEAAAEVALTAWLRYAGTVDEDEAALRAQASMLHLRNRVPKEGLDLALLALEDGYAGIVEETRQLESIRLALWAHDRRKTAALLKGMGIQNSSAYECGSLDVPAELVDVVEEIDPGQFELAWPLTHLKPFQRAAMCLGESTRMLLVRLTLPSGPSRQTSFCMHLYPGPRDLSKDRHQPCLVTRGGTPPDRHFCLGKPNRALYQLSRVLWQHLQGTNHTLQSVYDCITSALANFAKTCIVCSTVQTNAVGLLSSVPCSQNCSVAFRQSNLAVRLAALLYDPPVVDLLLTAAHATQASQASNGNLDLLPDCPLSGARLSRAFSSMPAASTLNASPDLDTAVHALGRDREALLSWVCTRFNGFLVSAAHGLRIPSMPPQCEQWVLVSASPEIESRFAAQVARLGSCVVFHGTTLDRLYRILCFGLCVMSNSPYQQNGAYGGNGIYLADDAQQSWGYAKGGGPSWAASKLHNMRVLLGVELASGPSSGGVHVVSDMSQVMVRYVFLFPSSSPQAPITSNIAPAMQSAFNMIRSGAIR